MRVAKSSAKLSKVKEAEETARATKNVAATAARSLTLAALFRRTRRKVGDIFRDCPETTSKVYGEISQSLLARLEDGVPECYVTLSGTGGNLGVAWRASV